MLSKQHVEVAHKFYAAQKAMKFLHGEKYNSEVAKASRPIRQCMEENKCNEVAATKICIETIVEQFPFDNGFVVAMLLATAVEMCENTK